MAECEKALIQQKMISFFLFNTAFARNRYVIEVIRIRIIRINGGYDGARYSRLQSTPHQVIYLNTFERK